jgi:hypothetical protein
MSLFYKLKGPVFIKESDNAEKELNTLKEMREKANGNLADKLDEEIYKVTSGIAGEKAVRYELENSHIPMYVIHDIYLEKDGLTSQIDYMIVTLKGTFVIECKNLYGNIEIDNNGNFIRTITYGHHTKKEGIYSPITQNRRHMELIKQIRSEDKNVLIRGSFEKHFFENYHSVVVLANPKTILSDRYAPKDVKSQVIRADQLAEYIRKTNAKDKRETMFESAMKDIAVYFVSKNKENKVDYTEKYRQLAGNNDRDVETDTDTQKDDKKMICPRCGAVLVKRVAVKGPNSGKEFYGCSNFPKCRFILNIDN